MNKSLNRITAGGVLIAFAIIIPQLFHFTGVPRSGQVFLPMHIPVLLSGFIIGPVFGLLVGIIAPIISSLITGMPDMARLPFMILELATYGCVSGAVYHYLKLKNKKLSINLSLVIAMIFGRVVYAISLFVAANLFQLAVSGPIAAITSVATGAIGIVIQLAIIPPLVYLLEKSGSLDRFFRVCAQGN
jgi:niacin transporter